MGIYYYSAECGQVYMGVYYYSAECGQVYMGIYYYIVQNVDKYTWGYTIKCLQVQDCLPQALPLTAYAKVANTTALSKVMP